MKKRIILVSLIVILVVSIVGLLLFEKNNKPDVGDAKIENIVETKTSNTTNNNVNTNENEQIEVEQYDEPIDYLIFDEDDKNIFEEKSNKRPQYIPSDEEFHDPEEEPIEPIDEPVIEEAKSIVEIDENGKVAIDLSDGNNKTEIIYE